jgi:hypothetical protein
VEVQEKEPTTYIDVGGDDDDTIDNKEKVMEELEPLFHDGCRLRSNFLDMDDEERLFVMELASQEKARAKEFPNGNREYDEAYHGDIRYD